MARLTALALLFGGAAAQTNPVTFTISATSPGLSSQTIGINLGHRDPEDPTWPAFLQRLGTNAARTFGAGGVPTGSTLMAVGANVTGWVMGKATDGTIVTTNAEFLSAITALSVTAAHTPKPASGAPVFALPWAAVDAAIAIRDASSGVSSYTAGSVDGAVATLAQLNIQPLLVQQIGCSSGPDGAGKMMFSSMDPTNSTYWSQRWELYKHSYVVASWAWRRGVKMIEPENEPDFTANNVPCWCTAAIWYDFILIRSLSIKNAYDDLNADLAAGKATVANGLCAPSGCPKGSVALNRLASAFANTAFSTTAPAESNIACSSSAAGSYTGLNGATVALHNKSFGTAGTSASYRNFESFSFHSYGAGGAGIAASGLANILGVSSTAFPTQVYVTEHSRYTGAAWDGELDSSDGPLSGSRIASQVVSMNALAANANSGNAAAAIPAGAGLNSFIFKFSMTPYNSGSSANLATALTSTSASPKMQSGTGSGIELGLQKHGVRSSLCQLVMCAPSD
jgi:hypothetical protein